MAESQLLFYAWTDMQLVNLTNLRMNQMRAGQADLVLLGLARITPSIIKAIQETGCFRNIHSIELDEASLVQARKRHDWAMLCAKLTKESRYIMKFEKALKGQRYDRVIIPGFWAETLALLKAVQKTSPEVWVDFIQEGSRHGEELFASTLSPSRMIRLYHTLKEGFRIRAWRRRCQNAYFYEPTRFQAEEEQCGIRYCPLAPQKTADTSLRQMLARIPVDPELVDLYDLRDVILLTDDALRWRRPDSFDVLDFWDLAEDAATLLGRERIIVRAHPACCLPEDRQVGTLTIDRSPLPLEILLLKLEAQRPGSVKQKTFLLGYSFICEAMVLAFGLQPTFISYRYLGHPIGKDDQLNDRRLSIAFPADYSELRTLLKTICN